MTRSNDVEILKQLRELPELFSDLENCPGSELAVQQALRAKYDAPLVRAAISLQQARGKAEGRLPDAAQLWLTTVGLEQSTAWQVAQHKAARFPSDQMVMDLCSGIGVDTAALLQRGPVASVDSDPAVSLSCQWNLERWRAAGVVPENHAHEAIVADVHDLQLQDSLIHIDPDRRCGRDRPVKRLEQYCPNLEWMQHAVQNVRGGALKLGPASNFMQKFADCEIEIVSLHGECREATVWFGELVGDGGFRATSLPTGETLAADPLSAWCAQANDVGKFIFDPDPAIVRSGLIDVLGERHDLCRLDQEDEYLTGESLPTTAFVKAYEVEECFPNNQQAVRKYLRSNPGRDYEIKCRRLKVDANAIQKKLPRGDGPIRTLFHLRVGSKARIVVTKRT